MYARVTTIQASPETVDQGIDQYREALSAFRGIAGNQGAFLLVERTSGRGIGATLWESEQAMIDSRQQADELRQRAAEQARGQIQSVEEYDVAVWDV